MKNKFFRRAAVLTAALFSFTCMSATAYAQSNEPVAETEPPAAEETTTKPFTPDGTGTVVDNATDEDGKEFFTITTPSENVFYLVIDRNAIAELLGSRTHLAAEGLVTWGIRSTTGGQFRDFGSAVDNDSENYEKNCQTAQELMKEAGYTAAKLKSLTPVIMLYESDGTADSLALLLQKRKKHLSMLY